MDVEAAHADGSRGQHCAGLTSAAALPILTAARHGSKAGLGCVDELRQPLNPPVSCPTIPTSPPQG